MTILLADDFEDGLDLYHEYLEYRGYRVIVARNGEEAIEQARTHRPDLIMMDIRMPVMSGEDAVRILRSDPSFARTPIIALTAHAFEGERLDALAAGFDELISKPCIPDQLVLAIERIREAVARKTEDKPPVDLFWSKRGVVACLTHAPAPASDIWRLHGWQQVPAWRRVVKMAVLQCQFCHGRPVTHVREENLAG